MGNVESGYYSSPKYGWHSQAIHGKVTYPQKAVPRQGVMTRGQKRKLDEAYKELIETDKKIARAIKYEKSRTLTQTKTKKPEKKKSLRYNMGKYVGAFRRAKRKYRVDPFKKYGVTTKLELQQVASAVNTAAVGHSTGCPQLMYRAFCRSLLMRLFSKAGYVIDDWNIEPTKGSANCDIKIFYRTDDVSITATQLTIAGFAGETHIQMADRIASALLGTVVGGNFQIYLEKAEMYSSTQDNMHSVVWLRGAKFAMDVSSLMVMQNVTESGEQTSDGHYADDITANPLVGRRWFCRGNTFRPQAGSVGFTGSIADNANGLISKQDFTRPKGTDFYANAKRSGFVHLQPGHIKKSKLRYKRTMNVNLFLAMIFKYMRANSLIGTVIDVQSNIGNSAVFHWELQLRASVDPTVKLNTEINLWCKAMLVPGAKPVPSRIEE